MAKPTTLDEVADAIVRMPLDEGPNDSHVSLLQGTGYMAHRGEITVEALYRRLAGRPDLLDAWQIWVDDNRGYPAWYFGPGVDGRFVVGRLTRPFDVTEREYFDDRAHACAEYVRREIDLIADVIDLWRRPSRLIPEIMKWFREAWHDRKRP